MTNPSYVEQQYHVYLCYVAGAVLAVLMNIPLFKYYSMLMRVMMFAINAGALIVFVTLLARASPKRDAWAVFVIVNETGWSSNGFVFLLGCLPGITAVNGFDSSTHVTDEIPDPATQIPKVMVWTSVLAGLSGLPMTIALMFCVVNEENLLAPIGGQPLAQLFVDSLDSKSLSLFLQSIYIIVFYIGCGALTTTFSRVLWSLAAERHIFFHDWVSALKGERQLPENAIYLAVTLSCAMGTLIFASSTVINAILGTAAICFFSSYMIPIACLLYDRKGLGDSKRTMNLGAVGPVLNWLSMAWMLLMSVVLLFPIYLPVTPSTMNYAVVVLAGIVFVYTLNWWLFARKNYRDPKEAKIEDTVASHDA
jgi:amino acid transporter